MLRLIVDSGSSIKQNEKDKYNVDIIPLKVNFNDKEYLDGVDISIDEFYHKLIDEQIFPKTSLPSLEYVENLVKKYPESDEILIITISSGISGSYNALRLFFEDYKNVYVYDSKLAVGAIRLLVEEVNKYRDSLSVKEIIKKLDELVPNIQIMAIPENLDYLCKGGRLSAKEKIIGNILGIKPVIGFKEGNVKVLTKKRGLKNAIKYLGTVLDDYEIDNNHHIIPSYTYDDKNLKDLINATDKKYYDLMIEEDNIDPAIACHWGPYAFGYIFVGKHKEENKESVIQTILNKTIKRGKNDEA